MKAAGRIEYAVVGRLATTQRGEQHNMITNSGWSALAAGNFQNFATFLAVGTGSTPPAPTDQTLAAPSGTRTQNSGGLPDAVNRVNPGVYELVWNREIPDGPGTAINATEWGFALESASPLTVRELFRDSQGNPIVVTKADAQKLRVRYTLRIELGRPIWTPGSIVIDGVGNVPGRLAVIGDTPSRMTDFAFTQSYLAGAGNVIRMGYLTSNPGTPTYDANVSRYILALVPQTVGAARADGREPWSCLIETGGANVNVWGVGFVSDNQDSNSTSVTYMFAFDAPLVKAADQRLTLRGPRLVVGPL